MKNKRFGLLMILAIAAFASSCGTSGYYATSMYEDGIYYRPTKESRARMIAAQEDLREKQEMRKYDQYLAKDEEGNLYVVTELLNGETYESRLRKFDSPWYTNSIWYGGWDTPWYNPWWSSYPYYGNSWTWGYAWLDSYYGWGYPYYYGRYNPWYYSWGYDPWYWGAGYAGWYGWDRWGRHHWYDYGHVQPGPGPKNGGNIVRTPRNSATGGGMYQRSGNSGSRGIYTTHRSNSSGTVSTRSSGSVRSGSSSRPVRTGASGSSGSSSSGSYTRSSGSYSSGGYSGGGSSGGSRSGGSSGSSVSGGTHSGGGRR